MCSLHFENNFLAILCVRFSSKIILSLSIVFASLRKIFCVLSEVFASLLKQFLTIERVRFASQKIFVLSNVFASVQLCKLFRKYCKILMHKHESKQILWLCICKCWQCQVKIWIIKGTWTKSNYLFIANRKKNLTFTWNSL